MDIFLHCRLDQFISNIYILHPSVFYLWDDLSPLWFSIALYDCKRYSVTLPKFRTRTCVVFATGMTDIRVSGLSFADVIRIKTQPTFCLHVNLSFGNSLQEEIRTLGLRICVQIVACHFAKLKHQSLLRWINTLKLYHRTCTHTSMRSISGLLVFHLQEIDIARNAVRQ
jgi:hypothetical protein